MKKRQAKKIMGFSPFKIYLKNLSCEEESKAIELLCIKHNYWYRRHYKYASIQMIRKERRVFPRWEWDWKRDHRITKAVKITHFHYGKYKP